MNSLQVQDVNYYKFGETMMG